MNSTIASTASGTQPVHHERSTAPTIVYVMVYHGQGRFPCLLGVSVSALRAVHPDAQVILICDPPTPAALQEQYSEVLDSIDKIIVEECPDAPNVAKAFYLKTRVPSLVKKDLVYLDADTLAVKPFYEEMSAGDWDVAFVQDRSHIHPIKPQFPEFVTPRLERMGWPYPLDKYFNAGIGFYRDTPGRYEMAVDWQQRWRRFWTEAGDHCDQPCLNVALNDSNLRIKELPAAFNAMVLVHPVHAINASIYHFFAGNRETLDDSLMEHLIQHYDRHREMDWEAFHRAVRLQHPWMPPYWPKRFWQSGRPLLALKYWIKNRFNKSH